MELINNINIKAFLSKNKHLNLSDLEVWYQFLQYQYPGYTQVIFETAKVYPSLINYKQTIKKGELIFRTPPVK
jgi:hypothetical protein